MLTEREKAVIGEAFNFGRVHEKLGHSHKLPAEIYKKLLDQCEARLTSEGIGQLETVGYTDFRDGLEQDDGKEPNLHSKALTLCYALTDERFNTDVCTEAVLNKIRKEINKKLGFGKAV